ncbi:hypothetical protein ACN38_g346 [Penicillium nordicum]|uniref:Uncharacterized protein n=1 Tax=Penicillium nordicum TaxID=229535 RepID=A0A0M8PDD8_9EURO|nr:hypothetical protein ACN38_g346 [Penicillium nordicum]
MPFSLPLRSSGAANPAPAPTDADVPVAVKITQADNVPKIISIRLSKIGLLEHKTNDPLVWKVAVEFALAPLRIKAIINSDIERPSEDHPRYDR